MIMRNIFPLLFFAAALVLGSCKKAEDKVYFEGGNPPALSASTSNVILEPGSEANTALILRWTNPNFMLRLASARKM